MKLQLSQVTMDAFDGEVFKAFVVQDDHWNGWAIPAFTRPQLEKVLEAQNKLEESVGAPHRSYIDDLEGGVLWYADAGDPPENEFQRCDPDEDGLYWFGSWEWCWEEVVPED